MTTQTRLDAYLETEIAILQGQEVRHGDKTYRQADLAEVRIAIKQLQSQLAREEASSNGSKMRFSIANLNRY